MKAYQADFSVSTLYRLHGVSESGYYAWVKRKPSLRALANLALGDRIEAIHRQSRSTYGRPRIQAELKDDGIGTEILHKGRKTSGSDREVMRHPLAAVRATMG